VATPVVKPAPAVVPAPAPTPTPTPVKPPREPAAAPVPRESAKTPTPPVALSADATRRCTDLLQRASIEPLRPADLVFLKRECRP
jgi:hypothetical protein